MKHEEIHRTAPAGHKVLYKHWPVSDPDAVIGMVHGLGEHSGRYLHLAEYFNASRIAVLAYDRTGHGLSEGKRGHAGKLEMMLDEITYMMELATDNYPGKATFLYGHSMGGNLVLNYVLLGDKLPIGLIASGPWITLTNEPSAILKSIARIAVRIAPSFTQSNGLDPNHVSSDPEEVIKYMQDPLVHDQISFTTAVEMIAAAEKLQQFRGKMPVPLLLMHGAEDKIIDKEGSQAFVSNLTGEVLYKEWPGMYHEIHNEPARLKVMNYILDWINQQLKN